MKLCVQYFNSRTNEHDKYETTFDELVDSFGWGELEFGDAITHTLNSQLIDSGKAIIKNGDGTTIVNHFSDPECNCIECADLDWDAPCLNCTLLGGSSAGMSNRDCCGCHEGDWHYELCRSGWWETNIIPIDRLMNVKVLDLNLEVTYEKFPEPTNTIPEVK